jgi:hypothetical protein
MDILVKKTLEVGDVVTLKGVCGYEGISDGEYRILGNSKGNFTKMKLVDEKYRDTFLEVGFVNLETTIDPLAETILYGNKGEEYTDDSYEELLKAFSCDDSKYNWWFIEPLDKNLCSVVLREYELERVLANGVAGN